MPPLSNPAGGAGNEAPSVAKSEGEPSHSKDIKKSIVYKRVPHVTLKSIANYPDFREGMTRQEIDEAAWSALYATVSRPFDCPESGHIAL